MSLPPGRRGWPRPRTRALIASAVSLLVLLIVAFALPVPFVKLAPGPTFNVIGEHDGEQVLQITGTTTYPVDGALDMTTVLESGGPRGGLTFVEALGSWFRASDAVLPREMLFPDDITGEEIKQRNAALFSTSESDAIGAAMHFLERPVQTNVVITTVWEDSPADGLLEPRDIVESVNGITVAKPGDVVDAVRSVPIGSEIVFGIRRGADATSSLVTLTSAANPDDASLPYIGIGVADFYTPEFSIRFALQDIGGPSAGLMFALGIIDRLTPENLADGSHIAGTGTIKPDGAVGPIGGIRQKLAGARDAGAELFLMPVSHCAEATGFVPDGLTVVPVGTLSEAVEAIDAWHSGGTLASCPAGP